MGMSPAQVHTVSVDGWSRILVRTTRLWSLSSPTRCPCGPSPCSPFTLCIPLLDQKNSATIHEESRQPCKGLINANRFDDFGLKDTAKCFSECARSGNESCNLGNLQR